MRMKKWILLLILVLLLAGCAEVPAETTASETTAAIVAVTEETEVPTTVPAETEPAEERLLLTFVGDCTFGASPANYYAWLGLWFVSILWADR